MSDSKTIYVTLDLRRALWIPESTGAIILCSYQSDLLPILRERGYEIWCFEEQFSEADIPSSTFHLLSRALTLQFLQGLQQKLHFLVFKPSNKIREWIEKQGWKLLAADVSVCRKLEDKLSFPELAEKHGLPIIPSEEVLWNQADLDEYWQQYGEKFVVQGRMGHAGSSSYLFEQGQELPEILDGTRVKICPWIEGKTSTINGHMAEQMRLGPLWQQVMGVPQWNQHALGTVGVTPVDGGEEQRRSLAEALKPLEALLKEQNYSGYFGLDLIWGQKGQEAAQWWLVECNPRLTASVSLQCLEDRLNKRESLLLDPLKPNNQNIIPEAQYGQLILRNSRARTWNTPKTLKSGIYRREEGSWTLIDRSVQAEKLEVGDILLLLSRDPGTAVDSGSDYASMLFIGSCLDENGSLQDLYLDFYERVVLGVMIREKDWWGDRFARVGETVATWRRPLAKGKRSLADRHRQSQVLSEEVVQLLGEYADSWLIQQSDGTKGWLSKEITIEEGLDGFEEAPGKQSMSAEEFLKAWEGSPYEWGGRSLQGVDCSAFVQRFYWEVLGQSLPKNSQDQRAACGQEVPKEELQDFDLVFLHSKEKGIAHVGIFSGGEVWHACLSKGVLHQTLQELQKSYAVEEFRRR